MDKTWVVLDAVPPGSAAASDQVVRALQDELAKALGAPVVSGLRHGRGRRYSRLLRLGGFGRTIARGIGGPLPSAFLIALSPYALLEAAPLFLRARGLRVALLHDVWPATWDHLVRYARALRLTHLFVTARQSADAVRALRPPCRVAWCPEGLPAGEIPYRPRAERDLDVIQFGRRHPGVHEELAALAARRGWSYVFEPSRGQLVAPRREQLLELISRAKVSIAYPRASTDPEMARGVSTMTLRYLESLAAGARVVGESPSDFPAVIGPRDPVLPYESLGEEGLARLLEEDDEQERRFWREEVLARHRFSNRLREVVLPALEER